MASHPSWTMDAALHGLHGARGAAAAVAALAALAAFVAGCGASPGSPSGDAGAPPADAPPCMRVPGWSRALAVHGGPIQETAVVALDGKVYVLGGFNATGGIVASVRVYDTASCQWSDGPALPRAVHHVNAAVAGDTIYVVGALVGGDFSPIGDVWAWRPGGAGGWTPRARMPAGTERGAAVTGVIGDRIYVAGGLGGGTVAAAAAYSISGDSWDTAVPPLPRPRDHACGGVVAGKLYVAGGRAAGAISNLVYELTPGAGWAERAAMPTARAGTACGVYDDRIVVVGGEGNAAAPSGVFPQVELYTVAADRWESLAPMPTPRHGMGAAVSGGVFYVPGGATRASFGAVDIHEALQL